GVLCSQAGASMRDGLGGVLRERSYCSTSTMPFATPQTSSAPGWQSLSGRMSTPPPSWQSASGTVDTGSPAAAARHTSALMIGGAVLVGAALIAVPMLFLGKAIPASEAKAPVTETAASVVPPPAETPPAPASAAASPGAPQPAVARPRAASAAPAEVTPNAETAGVEAGGETGLRAARAKFDARLYDQALADLKPIA